MSVADELAALAAEMAKRSTPERLALHNDAIDAVRRSGLIRPPRTGTPAPDFTLPDANGQPWTLSQAWSLGPVVLVFYRGGWCPFCNLQLRALQGMLPQFAARGTQLAALSPERPDHSPSSADRSALAFPVLSDARLQAANAYGLVMRLPPSLQRAYAESGIDLPTINGEDGWRLPVPATFVIGRGGRVILAHADVNYRLRLDPKDILAVLDRLTDAAADAIVDISTSA
jgi:peroxiredoxin